MNDFFKMFGCFGLDGYWIARIVETIGKTIIEVEKIKRESKCSSTKETR